MKRTKWYGGFQKPIRKGYYERDYWVAGEVQQDFWSGYMWILDGTDFVCKYQFLPWRGLIKEELK